VRTERLIIDGLGGQGVLLAGRLLTRAAMQAGQYATFLPTYGAEVRGGTSHCEVVVSAQPVTTPLVEAPSALLLLAAPSFARYADAAPDGSLLLANSSLVSADGYAGPARLVEVPATRMAEEAGLPAAANLVLVGAFLELTDLLSQQAMEAGLRAVLPERHHHTIPANLEALRRGRDAVGA